MIFNSEKVIIISFDGIYGLGFFLVLMLFVLNLFYKGKIVFSNFGWVCFCVDFNELMYCGVF